MGKLIAASFLSLALLTGCSSDDNADGATGKSTAKTYDLIGTSGEKIGNLALTETETGVLVIVTASGIAPGEHGIHLHHTGSCVTPDFKSAGGHINPMKKPHGLNNPDGPDNADMPNAIADAGGDVSYSYENARVSLQGAAHRPGLLDDNGSALVIHKNPDDGITQPIGGAGPRIACAEIN